MTTWNSADTLPAKDGEYLCYVRVMRRRQGTLTKTVQHRFMALEFAEGAFWIHGGAPNGMVQFWMEIPEVPK
jgi:hypothetical protein